jgi:hypothetical protein
LVGEKVAAGNNRSDVALIVGVPTVQRDSVHGWKGFEPIGLAGGQGRAADSGQRRQLAEYRGGGRGARPDGRARHAADLGRKLERCEAAADKLLVGVAEVKFIKRAGGARREIHGGDRIGVWREVSAPIAEVEVVLG